MKKILVFFVLFLCFISVSALTRSVKNDLSSEVSMANNGEFTFDPWSGNIYISGGIYRTCDSKVVLTLSKGSNGTYSGKITVMLGDEEHDMHSGKPTGRFDTYGGVLEGNVRAKGNAASIVVVLDNMRITKRGNGTINNMLKSGQQILKLTYNRGKYKATPIGKMENVIEPYMGIKVRK